MSGFPSVVELYMFICESKRAKKDLSRKVIKHIHKHICEYIARVAGALCEGNLLKTIRTMTLQRMMPGSPCQRLYDLATLHLGDNPPRYPENSISTFRRWIQSLLGQDSFWCEKVVQEGDVNIFCVGIGLSHVCLPDAVNVAIRVYYNCGAVLEPISPTILFTICAILWDGSQRAVPPF